MARKGNGLAALIAGFGTGYLNGQQQKRKNAQEDEDRALRNKEIKDRQAERDAQQQREADVMAGLDKASNMKVGELRNEQGVVDNSEAAWRERLAANPDNEGNLPTQEVIDQTAPIYAREAAKKGSEQWLSSDAPNAVMGEVKPTTKADIVRTQADAISKLGITGLAKSMELRDKADDLDLNDLKTRIANGTPESLSKDYDEIFPDGLTLGFDQGEDGKLYKYTTDADGNKSNWQVFNDLNHFKEQLMVMVDKDPDAIKQYWKESRAQDAANKKAADESKMNDLKYKELNQKIKTGEIELKNLPEKTRLEFAAKKAQIDSSNASAENSRASAKEKTSGSGGAKDDKLPTKVREAMWYKDASKDQKEAFDQLNIANDTKVTSDGLGGYMVNKPDGIYKVDAKGNVSEVPLGKKKPVPTDRPPLSAFDK
ncbi:MAG: hypothetical protein WC733_00210 [Methylophilus sp.]|jgi:hypothetical protein